MPAGNCMFGSSVSGPANAVANLPIARGGAPASGTKPYPPRAMLCTLLTNGSFAGVLMTLTDAAGRMIGQMTGGGGCTRITFSLGANVCLAMADSGESTSAPSFVCPFAYTGNLDDLAWPLNLNVPALGVGNNAALQVNWAGAGA